MGSTPISPLPCNVPLVSVWTQGRIEAFVSVSETALYLGQSELRAAAAVCLSALGRGTGDPFYHFSTKLQPCTLPGLYLDLAPRMEIPQVPRPKAFNSDSSFPYARLSNIFIRPSTIIHFLESLFLRLSTRFSRAQKQRF